MNLSISATIACEECSNLLGYIYVSKYFEIVLELVNDHYLKR